MSKIYSGKIVGSERLVEVLEIDPDDGRKTRRPLDLRLDLRNHSPTGFAWGYDGSGPSQLALALLADTLGDDERALALYQIFKEVVASLPQDQSWSFSDAFVHVIASAIEARRDLQ